MDLHVSIKPETLFEIGPIQITNSFLTMILVMVGLIVVGALVARNATLVPTHGQSIFEMTADFILGLVESAAGERIGRRIFPLIGGLFIFIIVANYAGLLPGVGTVGVYHEEEEDHARVAAVAAFQEDHSDEEEHGEVLVPFLRSPSADLNMTLAMSVFVVLIVQVAGIMAHGVGGRIKHMADPWWLFPIELIGEVARILSLAFRLFRQYLCWRSPGRGHGGVRSGNVLYLDAIHNDLSVRRSALWLRSGSGVRVAQSDLPCPGDGRWAWR